MNVSVSLPHPSRQCCSQLFIDPNPHRGSECSLAIPVTALSWSRVGSSPGPDPTCTQGRAGAAEHGQGTEWVADLVVLLPYP